MGYIESRLSSQEALLVRGRTSLGYTLVRPLLQAGQWVGMGLVASLIASTQGVTSPIQEYIVFGVSLMGILFQALPSLMEGLMLLLTLELGITNQRVIMRWGFFRKTVIDTYLSKIEGIDVDQTLLGRVLGYGSLRVRGTGGRTTPCPGVANPMEFQREVNETIHGGN